AAAWLVVGHVGTRRRVVDRLGLPRDQAVLDVDVPGARAGAVHPVSGTHHLVVRPAAAVGPLPVTVLRYELTPALLVDRTATQKSVRLEQGARRSGHIRCDIRRALSTRGRPTRSGSPPLRDRAVRTRSASPAARARRAVRASTHGGACTRPPGSPAPRRGTGSCPGRRSPRPPRPPAPSAGSRVPSAPSRTPPARRRAPARARSSGRSPRSPAAAVGPPES